MTNENDCLQKPGIGYIILNKYMSECVYSDIQALSLFTLYPVMSPDYFITVQEQIPKCYSILSRQMVKATSRFFFQL